MKISTVFYLIGQGVRNMFKNRLMSVAAITTISACIFVVSVFYIVGANISYMLDAVENNMGITVFFEYEVTQERILEIKDLLEARSEVHRVEYVSPEDAWESFKSSYFQGREDQLAGFEGENPLEDSASLIVYFEDLDTQKGLSDYVASLPDVRYIRQAEQVVNIMQSINQLVRFSSLALVTILVIISVFLISNTVRLGIATRKKEIEIMRYIGAKDSFIRGPFVIEGILIGVIGTAIPLGVVYYFYEDVTLRLAQQFSLLSNFLIFMDVSELFTVLIPLAGGVGILIGLLGSRFTIGRYLRA